MVMMFFYHLASNIAVHNFNSRFVVVIASGYDDQREPLLLGYVQREPENGEHWETIGKKKKKNGNFSFSVIFNENLNSVHFFFSGPWSLNPSILQITSLSVIFKVRSLS